jgi:hypothetical protein
LRHLLFNGALLYTTFELARHGQIPAAVIVGGLEAPFYIGNIIGAREAAVSHDRDRRMRFLEQAIEHTSR